MAAEEPERQPLPPIVAEVADLLLVLLKVQGHSGQVLLMFRDDGPGGTPHVMKVRRIDDFGRVDLARFDLEPTTTRES